MIAKFATLLLLLWVGSSGFSLQTSPAFSRVSNSKGPSPQRPEWNNSKVWHWNNQPRRYLFRTGPSTNSSSLFRGRRSVSTRNTNNAVGNARSQVLHPTSTCRCCCGCQPLFIVFPSCCPSQNSTFSNSTTNATSCDPPVHTKSSVDSNKPNGAAEYVSLNTAQAANTPCVQASQVKEGSQVLDGSQESKVKEGSQVLDGSQESQVKEGSQVHDGSQEIQVKKESQVHDGSQESQVKEGSQVHEGSQEIQVKKGSQVLDGSQESQVKEGSQVLDDWPNTSTTCCNSVLHGNDLITQLLLKSFNLALDAFSRCASATNITINIITPPGSSVDCDAGTNDDEKCSHLDV